MNKAGIYSLILIPISLLVIGQISTKYGALLLINSQERGLLSINFFIISGYICLVARGFVWIFILRKIDLSFAYTFLSISFVIILILSHFFFGEEISREKILGTFFIISGVIAIGFSEVRQK